MGQRVQSKFCSFVNADKVCPRNVFELVDRGDVIEDDDDFYDDDDEMKVMTIANALDCIGCMSCARVCPKQCHTHEALPG